MGLGAVLYIMLTTNDIGSTFVLRETNTPVQLVWFSESPDYVDGRGVLWCGVIPTWTLNSSLGPMEYTVRQDSLQRP